MNTLKFNQIEFNHIGEQSTSSIKLQEKSVTITENGTIEIVPDKGYALEKVNITTDIKGSGGGGNSDDSSSIEYYKVDENLISVLSGDNASVLTMFPNLVFIKNSSLGIMVTSFAVLITFFPGNNMTEILAQSQGIAFFMDASIMIGDTIATLRDLIGAETISKWQKITKDEFYNLGV